VNHFALEALTRFIMSGVLMVLEVNPTLAQFSARDGYAPDGSYRAQAELAPYLWLPATTGTVQIGNFGRNFNFDSGPPTPADLAHSLHGALVAFGLVRYGPWSGELDFQWIDAFHKTTVQPIAAGPSGTIKDSATLIRVAPGLGYQVFSGNPAGIPTTIDARVGFSVLTWSVSAKIEELPFSGADVSQSFVQPWGVPRLILSLDELALRARGECGRLRRGRRGVGLGRIRARLLLHHAMAGCHGRDPGTRLVRPRQRVGRVPTLDRHHVLRTSGRAWVPLLSQSLGEVRIGNFAALPYWRPKARRNL